MSAPAGNITMMLRSVASGDRRDLDALMAAIYHDLHRLAMSHMAAEQPNHTLQPTALVHEAYLKLIDQRSTNWQDRRQFFALASQIIRRILVDHARERHAAKRGGGRERLPLETAVFWHSGERADLLALDQALADLAEIDERQAKIVEMRFFGGLTIDEIAELLSISSRSVDRDWRCAKAWLYCELACEGEGASDDRRATGAGPAALRRPEDD